MEIAIRRAELPNNSVLPFVLYDDSQDNTQLIIPSPSFREEESPFREIPAQHS